MADGKHPRSEQVNSSWPAVLLVGLVAVVPLLVFPPLMHPYRDAKFALIWLTTAVVAALSARWFDRRVAYLPRAVLVSLGCYLAWLLVRSIGVTHPGRAANLYLEQAAMLLLLPLSGLLLSSARARSALGLAALVSTALVFITTLLQQLGFDPTGMSTAPDNPVSTLGYKNITGELYMLGGCVALGALLSPHPSERRRAMAALALTGSIYGMVVLQARGCALGFLIASPVLGAAWLRWRSLPPRPARRGSWRGPLVGVSVAMLLVLVAQIWGITSSDRQTEFRTAHPVGFPTILTSAQHREPQPAGEDEKEGQVRGSGVLDQSSIEIRLVRWRNAVTMWQQDPILGVGLGQFRIHYPPFGATDIEQDHNTSIHEAHNEYLQTLAETGVVGLLLQLALLAVIAVALWRRVQGEVAQGDTENLHFLLTAGAMMLGLCSYTFTSFALHNPVPATWLWVFLGAALGRPELAGGRPTSTTWRRVGALQQPAWLAIAVVFAVYGGCTSAASFLVQRGNKQAQFGQFAAAIEDLKLAAHHPNEDRSRRLLCHAYGKLEDYPSAIDACRRALHWQPHNHVVHAMLGRQLAASGQIQEALVQYRIARELCPRLDQVRREVKRLEQQAIDQ